MYVDLWQWFHESNHPQAHTFRSLSYQGWRFMHAAQSELAYQTFMDAHEQAKKLNLPCWELYFEYWACEVLIYNTVDRVKALDQTVRLAARAHQEQYKECRVLGRVYFILADIYVAIDVYGYEDKIREALNTLEADIPMDIDTHLRVMHIRAYFDYAFDQMDAAEKKVQEYIPIAQAEYNPNRQHDAYELLRRIETKRGNFHLAMSFAKQAENHGGQMGFPNAVAEERLWQGIFMLLMGNPQEAQNLYQSGINHFEQHKLDPWFSWYDAMCTYLECKGESEQALKLRYQQLEQVHIRTSIFNEGQTYLQLCRLLGRMGKPLDEALQNARAVAARMRKPEFYLQKLQAIETGMVDEYDWQARYRGTAS
jgi:tetratricopeptide (TPR) repeat protein